MSELTTQIPSLAHVWESERGIEIKIQVPYCETVNSSSCKRCWVRHGTVGGGVLLLLGQSQIFNMALRCFLTAPLHECYLPPSTSSGLNRLHRHSSRISNMTHLFCLRICLDSFFYLDRIPFSSLLPLS